MIHTIIAQAAPESIKSWLESFFWLVGSFGALLGCIIAWKSLFGAKEKTEIEQPLVVKAHSVPAIQADIDQIHGRIKRERLEIDAKIAELKLEDTRLREKLDEEIKDLQERVDDVPEKIVKLLNETGQFHRNRPQS